jgi:hypothetical protein
VVAMAEGLGAILLVAVFVLWFRRTASYKSRRRYRGGVPGQFSGPTPTFYGQRTNVPAPQPELRTEGHPVSGPWWHRRRRSTQSTSNETT